MASAALAPAGREYHFEDSEFSFNLTATGITNTAAGRAAVVGYAVSLDTSVTPAYGVAPTVKLAADDDEIFGRLEVVEDRTQDGLGLMCTVALRFIGALPLKAAETPAVGSGIIGAGAGLVKTRTASPATAVIAKPARVYGYDGTANFVNVAFGV